MKKILRNMLVTALVVFGAILLKPGLAVRADVIMDDYPRTYYDMPDGYSALTHFTDEIAPAGMDLSVLIVIGVAVVSIIALTVILLIYMKKTAAKRDEKLKRGNH